MSVVFIDENKGYECLAEKHDHSGVDYLQVDPTTGRLMADVVFNESGRAKATTIKLDDNFEWVATATDASGNIIPLQIDSNQNLKCDLIFE